MIRLLLTAILFSVFMQAPAKAESFLPACIADPSAHDYRATLERYSIDGRPFKTRRLKFEHMQKLISIWNSDKEHGNLKLSEWNMMQVVVTPEFAFSVRGRVVGEYVPICFVKRLTDKDMIDLFGTTASDIFNKETDS